MCRATFICPARSPKLKLLLTVSSFSDPDFVRTDNKDKQVLLLPSKSSIVLTVCFIAGALVLSENFFFVIFSKMMRNVNPIFDNELNCQILARHVGVDALASFVVGLTGYRNRHLLDEFFISLWNRIPGDNSKVVTVNMDDFLARIFKYTPEGLLILIYFIGYQIKNFVDTIIWNDGIVFVFHHIVALVAAGIGVIPNIAQFYGIFFMGMSEISTGVLSILACFDDEFGVKGLGDAFPMIKLVLGVLFVVLFVFVRLLLWPYFTYYFVKDCQNALDSNSPLVRTRVTTMSIRCLVSTCVLLSVLQLLFLGQIIVESHKMILSLNKI